MNPVKEQHGADKPRYQSSSVSSQWAKGGAADPAAKLDSKQRSRLFSGSSAWRGRVSRLFSGRDLFASGLRLARWNSAIALLVSSAGLFWWLGSQHAHRFGQHRVDENAVYFSPLEGVPKSSKAVENNNKTAKLHLPVNLEGTAVAYPEEVGGLVAADGSFRTELTLNEMATVLRISSQTIAKPRSKKEIDPDAVLFKAVTGKLSDAGQSRSAPGEGTRSASGRDRRRPPVMANG